MPVKFKATRDEMEKIAKIAARVRLHLEKMEYTPREIAMDLDACHSNGCPLDFNAMLDATRFDLLHDVLGIRRHLNRSTGKLENFFCPRMVAK